MMKNYDETENFVRYLNDLGKENNIIKPYNQCLKKQDEYKHILKKTLGKETLERIFVRLESGLDNTYKSLTLLAVYFASFGTLATIFALDSIGAGVLIMIIMIFMLLILIRTFFRESKEKQGYKVMVKECIEELEKNTEIKDKKMKEKINIQKALRKSSI